MARCCVWTKDEEEVREVAHRDGLVRLDAAHLIPVGLHRATVPAVYRHLEVHGREAIGCDEDVARVLLTRSSDHRVFGEMVDGVLCHMHILTMQRADIARIEYAAFASNRKGRRQERPILLWRLFMYELHTLIS